MPTGFTQYIESGQVTSGSEFLKLCTRAFGVAASIKDEPLSTPTPTHFEPNTYYLNLYESDIKYLERVQCYTLEDMRQKMIDDHMAMISTYKDCIERRSDINQRYENIKNQIELWVPPTEDHQSLKKFALDQINESMDSDYINFMKKQIDTSIDVSDEAVKQELDNTIAMARRSVERSKQLWQDELKRTEDRNSYMSELTKSLIELGQQENCNE